MTKDETRSAASAVIPRFGLRHSSFGFDSSFEFRTSGLRIALFLVADLVLRAALGRHQAAHGVALGGLLALGLDLFRGRGDGLVLRAADDLGDVAGDALFGFEFGLGVGLPSGGSARRAGLGAFLARGRFVALLGDA